MKIKAIIVVPCFNEALRLKTTCQTFGFGMNKGIANSDDVLIIVDNNSTDDTLLIAYEIQKQSTKKSVHIICESSQGHVPARHAGNLYALELCIKNNWDLSKIIIVQADADTYYSKDYVQTIKKASSFFGTNTLIETSSLYSLLFKKRNGNFINLCNIVDEKFSSLMINSKTNDVVIDDKSAAYRLIDYFNWGGHLREFFSSREEILAETSRLFIRAKLVNAKKVLLKTAYNIHSVRRLFSQPLLHFVTSGFPRENSYNLNWSTFNLNIRDFVKLPETNMDFWQEISKERQIHNLGFFCLLPLHIKRTKSNLQLVTNDLEDFALQNLPVRTQKELNSSPCRFIEDVFLLLEKQKSELLTIAEKTIKN